ncbi:MAG: MFS transporter [Chloroflexota bacterium]
MGTMTGATGEATRGEDIVGAPTATLPWTALVRLSLFWLGLTAIDSLITNAVQSRLKFDGLVPPESIGSSLAILAALTFGFSFFIQPTVGSISDYTTSRWGRRKPYIVVGAIFDAVFLIGIAMSSTFIALAAFITLLAISTNIARGPFQGYVPDLLPKRQVGVGSALVGMMQVVGNIVGFGLGALANIRGNVGLALVAVAVIELVTMISVVVRVPNGPPARPRNGRTWRSIGAETWGTDILREKSYLWLLASRLLILMGGASLVNFVVLYLTDVHRLSREAAGNAQLLMLAAVAVASLAAIFPSAKLSDRIGRKPVIYVSAALGAVSLVMAALAPNIAVAVVAAAIFGGSQGTFLAVDWALMTDIIPKAASGRYMGLSNVATQSSTTIAVIVAGLLLTAIAHTALPPGTGERVVLFLGVGYYLLGALTLRPVVEPARPRIAAVYPSPI